MLKFFQNAKEEPKVFYCKHIAPGVCAYADETILIGEEALKEMDKTFAGKPIYVNHQKVDLENIQQEADGYVAESFYLPEDGCHWAKMIIVSDKGHEAIRKGWKVSNAYVPDEFGIGGEWHNIPYNREVMKAHYTHLALVDNPRYEEAEVMTPEDFKMYKEQKREQLKSLENAKTKGEGKTMKWKLFKRTEVTNSDDLSNTMVELSNGTAISIGEMVNSVEKDIQEKEEAKNKCNDLLEEAVKVNGEEMKVKDLIKEYESKCNKCNEDEEDKEEDEEKKSKKASKKNVKKNGLPSAIEVNDAFEEAERKGLKGKEAEEYVRKKLGINAKKNEDEEKDKENGVDFLITDGESVLGTATDRGQAQRIQKLWQSRYPKAKIEIVEEKNSKSKKNEGEDIDKRKGIDEIGGFLKDKGLNDEDIRFVIGLAEKLSYEKDEAGKDNEDEEIEKDLTIEDKKNAKELLEAEEMANAKEFQGQVVDTMSRRLARGQDRYGSAK